MEATVYWFDMDHTLINNDCDVSWKYFAVDHKLAAPEAIAEADRFFDDYIAGRLDLAAFHLFQFREFIGKTEPEIRELAKLHFEERVRPKIYPAARKLIESLHARNIPTAILTSTNSMIARPLAEELGIPEVYGCTLEMIDGRCTGRVAGTYGIGPGKLAIAREVLAKRGISLAQTAYFGDSINDKNLLCEVGFPHAVNPSEELRRIAEAGNWPILKWSSEDV